MMYYKMSVLNPMGHFHGYPWVSVGHFRGYPWVISVGIGGSFPWVSVGYFRGYPWVVSMGRFHGFPWVISVGRFSCNKTIDCFTGFSTLL